MQSGLSAVVDRSLLQRAVSNLLDNTIKHSAGNKVLIGVKSANNKMIKIWVIDNGVGIDHAQSKSLFEDYAQGNSTAQGGFGLGLSSARRIVTLLGGSIAFEPEWKNGCAISIELKRA